MKTMSRTIPDLAKVTVHLRADGSGNGIVRYTDYRSADRENLDIDSDGTVWFPGDDYRDSYSRQSIRDAIASMQSEVRAA